MPTRPIPKAQARELIRLIADAEISGDWPLAVKLIESLMPLAPEADSDSLRTRHVNALFRANRIQDSVSACVQLLQDTTADLPLAALTLRNLTDKLGDSGPAEAVIQALSARRPVSRNGLLLEMMIADDDHQIVRAKSAMTALLRNVASPDELRMIFEVSARTHDACERGALLTELLRYLSDWGKKSAEPNDDVLMLQAQIQITMNAPALAHEALRRIKSRPLPQGALLLHWMASRLLDRRYPDFAAPKIFCIGLSKTGTSSLHSALGMLGIASAHWINPVTHNLLGVSDGLIFDAISDTSVSYRFEELYCAFPSARFIYTSRALASWESSFLRHFRRLGRDFAEMKASVETKRFKRYGLQWDTIHRGLYFSHESPAAAYGFFDRRIERFFADKPSDRLLRLDIFSGNGWNPLCRFLRRPIPDRPFPHSNKTIVNA